MPLVLPFAGAVFGGWLYDMLVFTGPSPVNSPWMGFKKLGRRDLRRRNEKDRIEQRQNSDTAEV